jgi:DNA-binding MarR family transcriptional regulator
MSTRSDPVAALDRLLEVTVLLGQDMADGLAAHGLTVARTTLLWQLRAHGSSTQRALADALGVSPRNVTGLVDGLVAGGLVTREPHPTDRRATLVSFTDRGARLVDELGAGQAELAGRLFGGLAPDRLDCLVAGLDEVLARLRVLVAGESS